MSVRTVNSAKRHRVDGHTTHSANEQTNARHTVTVTWAECSLVPAAVVDAHSRAALTTAGDMAQARAPIEESPCRMRRIVCCPEFGSRILPLDSH